MNKIFILVGVFFLAFWFFYYPKASTSKDKATSIGIVVPMQHAALDEIVEGFRSEIKQLMGEQNVKIEVINALGDINLQKSAINKFLNAPVDLLVPVATGTTQMALNLASKEQPILFLAANIFLNSKAAKDKPDLMGIIDEISVEKELSFIRDALSGLKKITLVYSASDKMLDEAENFMALAQKSGLAVQKFMVQNLSELYTISSHINPDSQAIIILKDNLVASGIEALVQQAQKLKIPLVSSDELSNAKGSAFALGVEEKDIGRQGAKIAAKFIKKEPVDKNIEYLHKISVFINTNACVAQQVNIEDVIKAAALHNYEVIKR